MASEIIREKVNKLLAEIFIIPSGDISDNLQFGDIPQWDSMGHMSVIAALEDEFHLEIDAELIANLTSIKAICDYLEERDHAK